MAQPRPRTARDSYQPAPRNPNTPYDYFHINSVSLAADGNLIISSRHTWTVYEVDRRTGRIIWRLGGKHSDFRLGPGVRFAWQHNPVPVGRTRCGSSTTSRTARPSSRSSRIITLRLDRQRGRPRWSSSIEHPDGLSAPSQGNAEQLPTATCSSDGGALAGSRSSARTAGCCSTRSSRPATTPTAPTASPGRATPPRRRRPRRDGTGRTRPSTPSGTARQTSPAGRILAGPDPGSPEPVASVPWNGLDTTTQLARHARWVEVAAEGASGQTLATSAPVRVTG